jgi:DNA-binding MarR family transcriptional regulator
MNIDPSYLNNIATDKTITPTALCILVTMMFKRNYTQADLKNLFHIAQGDISKALKMLVDKGLVEKVEQRNQFYLYKLNSDYFRKRHR